LQTPWFAEINKHGVQQLFIGFLHRDSKILWNCRVPAQRTNGTSEEVIPVQKAAIRSLCAILLLVSVARPRPAHAQNGLQKVNHIIIMMQENHSFDDYFGALAYAPGSPYHVPHANSGCEPDDHACVDGLSCTLDALGELHCINSNLDDNGLQVFAFHNPSRCVAPDLNHSWFPVHQEVNDSNPDNTLGQSLNDGFVRVNDSTEQIDNGTETPTDDQTIGFYNQSDIPFYYDLAEKFAMSDRHFSSVLGPTFPNRSYLMAATSFGHLTTNDTFPPAGSTGYKPITGTIFDLLDQNKVTWADYFQDAPQGASFRIFSSTNIDPHFLPLANFFTQAATGTLPSVSFVDPNFGLTGTATEDDEHPPTDIQRGQAYISQAINAVRNGPNWKDSIIFLTYDEHGGFYDHAVPPAAPQDHALTPDGIAPGQCADLSNPPASENPGGGAECSANLLSTTDTSVKDAELLCPALASNPTGPYPANCPTFNQLGVRIPFIAISPFSRPHYVSHIAGDHTSMLALIERRFLATAGKHGATPAHLTLRDEFANDMQDMFDFTSSPSLNTLLTQALPPTNDCTPVKAP
jgi:phospholipase C